MEVEPELAAEEVAAAAAEVEEEVTAAAAALTVDAEAVALEDTAMFSPPSVEAAAAVEEDAEIEVEETTVAFPLKVVSDAVEFEPLTRQVFPDLLRTLVSPTLRSTSRGEAALTRSASRA